MNHRAFVCATILALAATATAQNCSDNTYPIRLVDATGTQVPSTGSGSATVHLPANESVFMAFDPALPSGLYLVMVTDPIGGHDEVLSLAPVTDRLVQVTNNAGVISLSLPYSVSAEVPAFGLGLNGVGESMPLYPFLSASWDPCNFKAWLGNYWNEPLDGSNPYVLKGGFNSTIGQCAVRSYVSFRIGDGTGSDVTGFVFDDLDRDGVLDDGEPGLVGEEVRLVTTSGSLSVFTDDLGAYRFVDVPAGTYTVEITVSTGSVATTPVTQTIDVCGCSDVEVPGFGRAQECLRTDGHTIGYWRNCHGLTLIRDNNLLPQINGLGLVDGCGRRVSFATLSQYACWLQGANATNMAYMLSAQLTAMYLNIAVGYVDSGALIDDPVLGRITIGEVVARAIASLAGTTWTPRCSAGRAGQEALKNALDNANNNRNWVNPCGCDETPTCSPQPCDPTPTCDPHQSGGSHCARPSRPNCARRSSWSRCR